MKKIVSVIALVLVMAMAMSFMSVLASAEDSPVRPTQAAVTSPLPIVIWSDEDGTPVLRFVDEDKTTTIATVEQDKVSLLAPSATTGLTDKQLETFASAYEDALKEDQKKVLYSFWLGLNEGELNAYFNNENLQGYCPFYDDIKEAAEATSAEKTGYLELPIEVDSLSAGDSVEVYVNGKQLPADDVVAEDGKLTMYLPSQGAITILLAE